MLNTAISLFHRTSWGLRELLKTHVFYSTKVRTLPQGFQFVATNSHGHKLMLEGTFEAEEAEVFNAELAACDVLVDVGANIGYYTCIACAQGKQVVAFEPMPFNLRLLYENLRINGWGEAVEVFPVGAGAGPGLASIYSASSTGASLVKGWASSTGYIHRTIPINALDRVLGARFAGKRVFVKIDIEGAEYAALRGATGLMKQNPAPVFVVEITLDQFYPGSKNPHFLDTFKLMFDHGYEAFNALAPITRVTPDDVEAWYSGAKINNRAYNFLFRKRA